MEPISVNGFVSSISSRNKSNIIFNLKSGDVTYKITCPFFCPVQEHDTVFISECKMVTTQELTALTQPFVSIPENKEGIKEQFFKILRGSGFGVVSASRLYDHVASLAKDCGYGSSHAHQFTGDSHLSVNTRTKYSGDGVEAFISEMAAQFHETRNKSLPELFASNFETKVNTGINVLQARKLLFEWYNKRSLRKLYLLGLTKGEIISSGVSLDDLYDICVTNPYRIPSINISKCDAILTSIRRSVSETEKMYGRLNRYVYKATHERSNTCVTELELRKTFPFYDQMTPEILKSYFLVADDKKVYLQTVYKIETSVVQYINNLISQTAEAYERKSKSVQDFSNLQTAFYECKTLTEEQQKAIDGALNCKLCIITGAAGTGKSTILREITKSLELRDKKFAICAFTGKAVSRIHEVMHNNLATTIDRFILDIRRGLTQAPSHIIIDEGSMVTTELFYRLIKAIDGQSIAITLVGDCNQLPPIGWGNLMRELMNSNRIPLFYLTKNQRILPQNDVKDLLANVPAEAKFDRFILENANMLIDRHRPHSKPMEFKEGDGFYILPGATNTVTSILKALKEAAYNPDDILILSPYKAYLQELNSIFQSIFLEDSFKFEQPTLSGTRLWCIGDRVMMTHNNYDIGVMNGEEGKVHEITDEGLKILFKDTLHTFKFVQSGETPEDKDDDIEDAKKNKDEVEELKSCDLIHSFAVSVHKSQGSEAKYVILFLPEDRNFTNFLNINLIYTAITRTKKTIWIVSSKSLLGKISQTSLPYKNDGLGERLRNMKNVEKEKILETFVLSPSFETSLNSSVGLTAVPDYVDIDNEMNLYDDLWD